MFLSQAADFLYVADIKICCYSFWNGIIIHFVPPIQEHDSFGEFHMVSTAMLLIL
jgi:hypothetical protein